LLPPSHLRHPATVAGQRDGVQIACGPLTGGPGRPGATVALRVPAALSHEGLLSALPILAPTGSNGRSFATIVAPASACRKGAQRHAEDMTLVVRQAVEGDKPIVHRLLELNAYEFSAFDGQDIGPDGE
jgi:hypothetical protein